MKIGEQPQTHPKSSWLAYALAYGACSSKAPAAEEQPRGVAEPQPDPIDDNATTWRDLTDQLTPEQIAKLEESERSYRSDAASLPMWCTWAPRTESDIVTTLLRLARADVADNLNDVLFTEIALRAGAVSALPWDSDGSRCFDGSSWCIERNASGADIQVDCRRPVRRTGESSAGSRFMNCIT